MELDILAQHPRINTLYTNLTFCFPIPYEPQLQYDMVQKARTKHMLLRGLKCLGEAFPWLAGEVVNDSGTFKIVDRKANAAPWLSENDLSDNPTSLDWDALEHANCPFYMLDEAILASTPTLKEERPQYPVFLIHAVYLRGALLLTVSAHHGAMDVAGLAWTVRMLGMALRGGQFRQEDLKVGNMNRRDIVLNMDRREVQVLSPFITEKAPVLDPRNRWSNVRVSPSPEKLSNPVLDWAYFGFFETSLIELKRNAMRNGSGVPAGKFVSTDDVLSAFIWQSITRVRAPRFKGSPSNLTTMLSRNVDMRRFLEIPADYPGFLVHSTTHVFEFAHLLWDSLGAVAQRLRDALDPEKLRHEVKAQAEHIQKTGAPGKPVEEIPGLDVRLSSWAKEDCCYVDFGPHIGNPSAVRRPRMGQGSREGLVYFLPRTRAGAIIVGMCLRKEDMAAMKRDSDVQKYSTFIG